MTELKAKHAFDVYEYYTKTGDDDAAQVYIKSEADKFIAELEEKHKKEVDRLLMKISGLELLVETADKIIKQKGGFTIKDVEFGGIKLEGIKEASNGKTE